MKLFVGSIAAMLLTGAAVPAFANASASAASAPVNAAACTGPEHTWQRFGADPFAKSEAEGLKKLPIALKHAVDLGCMPQAVADALLKAVHDNPKGMTADGKTQILLPGTRLAFTESGKHPSVNTVIGTSYTGPGLVTGIEVKVWAVKDSVTGITYTWYMPYVCFNWSLAISVQPPAPKTTEPDCVVNNYAVSEATDAFLHVTGTRVDMKDVCTAYRYLGETGWRRITDCPDNCVYTERLRAQMQEKVGNADITFKAKIPVVPKERTVEKVTIIQVRTSRLSIDSKAQVALLACLERLNGAMSDGVLTRHDDYRFYEVRKQYIASVYHSQSAVPKSWTGRQLYFRFSGQ